MTSAVDREVPRVNALVGLLQEHRPEELRRLQARYPEYAQVLRPGTTLGAAPAATGPLLELALIALLEVDPQVTATLGKLRARLVRAKNLRLVGTICTTVTGAGVIAALVANQALAAGIAAVVNFVISLATLAAEHLESPAMGGRANLLESYEKLSAASARAPALRMEMEACLRANCGGTQAAGLVQQSNDLAAQLRLVQHRL